MPQLQAGYCLEGIKEELERKILSNYPVSHLNELLGHLSFFEIDASFTLSEKNFKCHPLFLVASNIISRGLPTRPSVFIEKIFSETYGFTKVAQNKQIGSFKFEANNLTEEQINNLYRALFIIEPRIKPQELYKRYTRSWEKLDSRFEEEFILKSVPAFVNTSINQIIEVQRPMTSIVNNNADFTEQRVDFTIEFPFPIEDKKGLVIEVDGPQHDKSPQKELDDLRDNAVLNASWRSTLRIKTKEFDFIQRKLERMSQLANHWYFNLIEENYRNGFRLSTLETILSPIAIARVQKVILEFIISVKLDFNKKPWKIVILERDVTCGWLAVEDLKKLLDNLFILKGEKNPIPDIQLSIINTEGFNKSKLGKHNQCEVFGINEVPEELSCDLLIDVSVLQRPGFANYRPSINYHHFAEIRSIHSIKSKRKFKTGDLIKYIEFAKKLDNGKYEFDTERVMILESFLQDIFRKSKFREGQIEILNKALQAETVIGLLPTGGGKSLTYQLASLLQPGVTLIVDPIKSLMKDQVDNLNKNFMDACNVINSSIPKKEKLANLKKMVQGETLFTFISPERLQMNEFRDALKQMAESHVHFNYCIIDEVHCVSEWGHDFRTAYLRLGENAIKYCKTKNKRTIPLFGLTATASYDVLIDVQRELSGNDPKNKVTEDNIVQSKTTIRKKLEYYVFNITGDQKGNDYWEVIKHVGKAKQDAINQIIQQHIQAFREDPNFSGLIFCPHRSYFYGVTDKYKTLDQNTDGEVKLNGVYDRISYPEIKTGTFIGADSDDDKINKIIIEESIQNQDDFVNNKKNLLVASKAFGMGIDKPNIRFTLHLNYPNSVESFVQESGRAGRDKDIAHCYILFNEQKYEERNRLFELDLQINRYFHNNSFKGADKEKLNLKELLTEIRQPDQTVTLSNLVLDQFNVSVSLSIGDFYLFINDSENFEKKYGWIKLSNLTFRDDQISENVDTVLARNIYSFIRKYIVDHCNGDYRGWLAQSPKDRGIEYLLNERKINEDFDLTVSFTNDIKNRIDQITDWLQKVVMRYFNSQRIYFKKEHVIYAKSKSTDFLSFLEKLEDDYNRFYNGTELLSIPKFCLKIDKERKHQPGTTEKAFENIYNGYRDKADTEKAIYRLSVLGVIDDYVVDYRTKTFTLFGKKKKSLEYKKNLINYIAKYYSKEKALQILADIENYEGETNIQKYLNRLIDFIYEEVAQKRFIAIDTMKKLCQKGIEEGDFGMKEFIDLYFNSKYANPYEKPNNLIADTNNLEDFDFEIVKLYIEEVVGDSINNLKHLKGACSRLFTDRTASINNLVIQLLNAYALYMLDYANARVLKEANESLINGLNLYFESNGSDDKDLKNKFEYFKKQLFTRNPDIEKHFELTLDDILIEKKLDGYLKIIKKTNEKILADYETGSY